MFICISYYLQNTEENLNCNYFFVIIHYDREAEVTKGGILTHERGYKTKWTDDVMERYEKQPKNYQVYKTQHLQQKTKDRASQNTIIIKTWVDLRSSGSIHFFHFMIFNLLQKASVRSNWGYILNKEKDQTTRTEMRRQTRDNKKRTMANKGLINPLIQPRLSHNILYMG